MTFEALQSLSNIIGFAVLSTIFSFAWSPLLISLLYRYKLVRNSEYDVTLSMDSRKDKTNVPVMGGLLIVVTVFVLTFIFNWQRSFTWVPIGVMLLAALLGGVDDILNMYGTPRRSRSLANTIRLIKVHKFWYMQLWLVISLPWTIFKRSSLWLGSHPGKGIHVHEKLLLQFFTGAITAWWVYFKLGQYWQFIYIPFHGYLNLGWLIVPLIIFIVMFTANAVNIADGMDGLAGGMLIPTFTALLFLSWIKGVPSMAILNATVVGSLITYTYFNIKPARFQMGDVGSLSLGALLAINALVIGQTAVLIFLGFMFYVEAFSVVIQVFGKYFFGKRILRMAPLHHHFEMIGWSEEKTVMRFWILHLAAVLIGIWFALH